MLSTKVTLSNKLYIFGLYHIRSVCAYWLHRKDARALEIFNVEI